MFCGKRFLIILGAALAFAAPAAAITGGSADGNGHPAVGLVAADNGEICTGFLVSATTFVTAAHCFTGAGPVVVVSFDAQVTSQPSLLGLAVADPQYDPASSKDTHDIAVVHLQFPVTDRTITASIPRLPTLGLLDQKAVRSQTVVDVGYGLTSKDPSTFDGVRRVATSNVTNVKATELHLSQNPGGVCFGDSGGPHLLGNVAVAITSSGNKNCNGQSLNYRLDTPSARAFLQSQGVTTP